MRGVGSVSSSRYFLQDECMFWQIKWDVVS